MIRAQISYAVLLTALVSTFSCASMGFDQGDMLREAVDALFLEEFKARLDGPLSSLV